MTYSKLNGVTGAALMALAVAGAPAALAQTGQSPAQPPQTQTPQASNFKQEELKSYAVAALEVQKIKQSYAPKMQSASPGKQEKLQEEAMGKMSQAVESKGLDVQTYNNITRAVQSDQELASKVQNYMAEQQ